MDIRPYTFAFCLAAGGGSIFAQCEASKPVRDVLQKPEFRRKIVETQEQKDARASAFRKALSEYPDNYFILVRKVSSLEDAGDALAWAQEEHRRHPNVLVYEMIEAEAMLGLNTPEAIRRLEALKAAHPDQPRIDLQLASAYGFGKFRDKPRVQAELDAYLKLCPDSTDGRFLSALSGNGSAAQIAAEAAALRKHLEGQAGEPDRNLWETLWKLEFKAHPLAEHGAVRKKIGEDLARFESRPDDGTAWLTFLRGGYESIGDTARVDRIDAEILEKHAKSSEALRIEQERFRKEHPYPPQADEEKGVAWRRLHLAAAREWLKNAPNDSWTLSQIADDMSELPDTKAEDYLAAVDRFLDAYQKDSNFVDTPPFEWRIAAAYTRYKVRLEQVPALVGSSYQAMVKRQKSFMDDDRGEITGGTEAADYYQVRRARLLVDCYAVTHDVEKARQAVAAVSLKEPEKQKAGFLAVKAIAAEIEGRKADALMMYRTALDAVPARAGQRGRDDMIKEIARVWKEMGGTPEGYALLMERPKIEEATESRWEKPRNPLPAFTLTDLGGKSWTLARLEGKTLLINVWATWCGPCMAEHPEFQKLYDKLKDRPDVSILSFNVDEDMGKVAPYIAEHKYTFPVIPAKDVVDAVVPQLAIPRNWLVDAKGKLQWEQIGFGNDATWQEAILAKLDEVAKSRK
ncbi:MAG TPA: redoxin family protein [Bryobacteraceae bacterium]|jgi:thiol-disulfide isomerase/thioredoxin